MHYFIHFVFTLLFLSPFIAAVMLFVNRTRRLFPLLADKSGSKIITITAWSVLILTFTAENVGDTDRMAVLLLLTPVVLLGCLLLYLAGRRSRRATHPATAYIAAAEYPASKPLSRKRTAIWIAGILLLVLTCVCLPALGVTLLVLSPVWLLLLLLFYLVRRRRIREAALAQANAVAIEEEDLSPYSIIKLCPPFKLVNLWVTVSLLLALLGIYVCELAFAVIPGKDAFTPSYITLLALGSLGKSMLRHGEWYRFFTAPLLHASLSHLLCNCFVLFYAGWILESRIGRDWLLAIYGLGGVFGGMMSVQMNAENVFSVGASGAIMALLGALAMLSLHPFARKIKRGIHSITIRIAIPALLPGVSQGTLTVDYAAHFGGFICGTASAAIMLTCWPENLQFPKFRMPAAGVAALVVAATLVSVYEIASHYSEYTIIAQYRVSCIKELVTVEEDSRELRRCILDHIKQDHPGQY